MIRTRKTISERLQQSLAEIIADVKSEKIPLEDAVGAAFWVGVSSQRRPGLKRISVEEREEQNREYELEDYRRQIRELATIIFPAIISNMHLNIGADVAALAVAHAISIDEYVQKGVTTGRKSFP